MLAGVLAPSSHSGTQAGRIADVSSHWFQGQREKELWKILPSSLNPLAWRRDLTFSHSSLSSAPHRAEPSHKGRAGNTGCTQWRPPYPPSWPSWGHYEWIAGLPALLSTLCTEVSDFSNHPSDNVSLCLRLMIIAFQMKPIFSCHLRALPDLVSITFYGAHKYP